MKKLKTFEEFSKELNAPHIDEDAIDAGEDSKVVIDDVTLDSGSEIKSTEILGAILSSKTEKEFKEYFYDQYGNGAFTDEDISTLIKFFLEYQEEKNAEEAEGEEEAPGETSGEAGDEEEGDISTDLDDELDNI